MTDQSAVLVPGPWRHHFVAANGARFHVAEAGPEASTDRPLLLLLPGFPQNWWAWRAQLPALAEAGYRTVAMDLRGTGASDKPPHGYDAPTLAQDALGVVRSLGATEAVVIGHGVGGAVAWTAAARAPDLVRGAVVLSAPHPPHVSSGALVRAMLTRSAARHVLGVLVPGYAERALTRGDALTRILTDGWADHAPDRDVVGTWKSFARVPFAAHSAAETVRWLVRSTPRPDGLRWRASLADVAVPVLHLHGSHDPYLPAHRARHPVGSPFRFALIDDAGHFPAEEQPEAVTGALLGWLAGLRRPGATPG